MTAGCAIASWKNPKRPLLVVAADTRISRRVGDEMRRVNDASVKTLEIADQVAAVFSGDALPTLIAAELTRTILRAQADKDPAKRLGFFDTARLICHFLSKATENLGDCSEVLVAGYYRSGSPDLARILVTDDKSWVSFLKCEPGGTIALAVGPAEAQRVLLRGIERAKHEDKKLVLASLALLEYMIRHGEHADEGKSTFRTVGGQISIGACDSLSSRFKWPALSVGDRLYWRGMDVTGNWSASWDSPVRVPYDETWCAEVDHETQQVPSPDMGEPARGSLATLDVATVAVEELFKIHPDPLGF